jgi:hypothetical protein
VVVLLCGFNLRTFSGSFTGFVASSSGEIVDVNAAQTAGFCTGQNSGFILID